MPKDKASSPTKAQRPTPIPSVPSRAQPVVRVPTKMTEASGNWNMLRMEMNSTHNPNARFENRRKLAAAAFVPSASSVPFVPSASSPSAPASGALATMNVVNHQRVGYQPHPQQQLMPLYRLPNSQLTHALAIDCEMVGVGPLGESALARVSIVNEGGCCVMDRYVKPKVPVTDYRTKVSGIRPENLVNAGSLDTVIHEVAEMIQGRLAVGHAIHHDFKVLFIRHPRYMIRDTSMYFKKANQGKTPSLKTLALRFLGMDIQSGEHSSVEDAQAVMKIYLKHRDEWEGRLSLHGRNRAESVAQSPLPPLPVSKF